MQEPRILWYRDDVLINPHTVTSTTTATTSTTTVTSTTTSTTAATNQLTTTASPVRNDAKFHTKILASIKPEVVNVDGQSANESPVEPTLIGGRNVNQGILVNTKHGPDGVERFDSMEIINFLF